MPPFGLNARMAGPPRRHSALLAILLRPSLCEALRHGRKQEMQKIEGA